MKFAAILFVTFLAVAYVVARPEDDMYTDKFDKIDIDNILSSDRLLTNYKNCLLNKGRCTPDGAELKRVLPEAIATNCAKCSEKQKEISKRVIKFLSEKKPEIFKELMDTYDPDGKFREQYKEEAKKAGINV